MAIIAMKETYWKAFHNQVEIYENVVVLAVQDGNADAG
jgi:hypothetical protein